MPVSQEHRFRITSMAHFVTFYFFNFRYGCACVWVCAGDSSACKDRSVSSLDMDLGSCEPPEAGAGKYRETIQGLAIFPPPFLTFPLRPPPPFSLWHICLRAQHCVVCSGRLENRFPFHLWQPLNLVLSGATPLLPLWSQSVSSIGSLQS